MSETSGESSSSKVSTGRLRHIDGLRALAVLPVIFFHADVPFFTGGYIGVDVFFVISGFLITSLIYRDIEESSFSFASFFERRARRILPALFATIMVSSIVAWFLLLPGDMKNYSESVVATTFSLSNILFYLESGYFDTASELKPLLHTWSLAVEEQFYLLWPLLLIGLMRVSWKFTRVAVTSLVILSLVASEFMLDSDPAAAYFLLPFRAWELLLGAALYLFTFKRSTRKSSPPAQEVATLVGIAMIIGSSIYFDSNTPFPGYAALVPTLGTLLVIRHGSGGIFTKTILESKVLVRAGILSYSAYLVHQPVLAFLRIEQGSKDLGPASIGTSLVLTFVLATLLHNLVEQPFRDRSAFPKRKFMSSLTIFALASAALGSFGFASNGFQDRFEKNLRGDVGHLAFHQYLDDRFFDCTPESLARSALTWNSFLRCKQSGLGTPDVVLLGDSHAEHLFFGVANGLPSRNVAFYTQAGPPFMTNPAYEEIRAALRQLAPNSLVMVTMQYLGSPESQGAPLEENLMMLLDELTNSALHVVMVGDVPVFRQFPELCLYSSHPGDIDSSCQLSRREAESQEQLYKPIIERVISNYTDVSYLSLLNSLCDESFCYMANDESVLFRDPGHLNLIGSQEVGAYLALEVAELVGFDSK